MVAVSPTMRVTVVQFRLASSYFFFYQCIFLTPKLASRGHGIYSGVNVTLPSTFFSDRPDLCYHRFPYLKVAH